MPFQCELHSFYTFVWNSSHYYKYQTRFFENVYRSPCIVPLVLSDVKDIWTSCTEFYVYGSVHRWSILIIVQRVATQSSLFVILQVHSTCFGCQPHQLSVYKTVTTASGTVQLPHSNVAKLTWPRWSEVAAQKNTSTRGCSYSFVYSSWWVFGTRNM